MKLIPSNIACPGCGGAMVPAVVRCAGCELRVSGNFALLNEFATLLPEDLHFLRIFVHCEGRIRDMESALGVSYPTIKGKLVKLKEELGARVAMNGKGRLEAGGTEKEPAADVLDELAAGKLSVEEAAERFRSKRGAE